MERTVKPEDLKAANALVLDVRREGDYSASSDVIPGSLWKNPERIDEWITALPKTQEIVIYCARGGSVSNSVVDRMLAEGIQARFIEGGIEGYKASGAKVEKK
jgi:rhodanese-related sulfurtransferase